MTVVRPGRRPPPAGDAGNLALLAALSLVPLVIEQRGRSPRALAVWVVGFLAVTASILAVLAAVGARHTTVFFDL